MMAKERKAVNDHRMDKQWHREPGYIIIHRTEEEKAWDAERRRRAEAREEAERNKFFNKHFMLVMTLGWLVLVLVAWQVGLFDSKPDLPIKPGEHVEQFDPGLGPCEITGCMGD
jgi:hypothetical protein